MNKRISILHERKKAKVSPIVYLAIILGLVLRIITQSLFRAEKENTLLTGNLAESFLKRKGSWKNGLSDLGL
jgi:hypothetical protein